VTKLACIFAKRLPIYHSRVCQGKRLPSWVLTKKNQDGYNCFYFFSAWVFSKEKIEMWIFVFKTEIKQVLTFNLEKFGHVRKDEQKIVYINIITRLKAGNLAHDW
jgi:hypothetical protein